MSVHYTEDFKKEVVKAYMAGDKSIPQIAVEFNVAKSSVSKWVNEYKEECLYTTSTTAESNEAKEIRRLNQLLNEKDKEIAFLKKAAAACFPAESYAATAVNISAQRYGTQTANTEQLSGNATLSSTAIKSAEHHTIPRQN